MTDQNNEAQEKQSTTRQFLMVRGQDVTGKKHPTSYIDTLAHCVKGHVGTGIFAMGWAFMCSGMLFGPILMCILGTMNLHCEHILTRACCKILEKESAEVLPTYAETVQYTFENSPSPWLQKRSRAFGIMTDVFLLLSEYGCCIVYFNFISNHIGEITASHGWKQDYRVILAIIFIPMWLSTFLGNLKLLAPVSMFANLIVWAGIILIVYYSTKELPPLSERSWQVPHVEKVPMVFGVIIFAFTGIALVVPMRMEMKNPKTFTSVWGVLNVSMFICFLLYGLVGFLAYWQWGEDAKGSVFLNLPSEETLSQVIVAIISLGILLTYTLHMYVAFEILYPRFHRRWGPFKHPVFMIYTFKSCAVLTTYVLANITSNLATFISLVGALTGAVSCLLFPALLDLIMRQGELTYLIITKDIIIIITAIGAAITGTCMSVMDIVKEYTGDDA